jgi:hypothetical protein
MKFDHVAESSLAYILHVRIYFTCKKSNCKREERMRNPTLFSSVELVESC